MNPTKLVLGARYNESIWPLSQYLYYNEGLNTAHNVRPPIVGHAPRSVRPPLPVATTGIQKCFGIGPVMGSDPEVFIGKGDARVAAFKELPDKGSARKKQALDGDAIPNWFWDGFQAETTLNPLECHTSFASGWWQALTKLHQAGLKALPGSVWRVPEADLQQAEEAHVGLGCSPSFNAYNIEGRHVENPRFLKWRFAGGHIHFGCDLKALDALGASTPYIVKAIDCFLGVPSVALYQKYDSPIRRRYYGLPGEFRTPKHGLEYRVLSNGWLMDPQAFQLTLDLARHAFNLGRTRLRRIWVGREEMVRDVIQYNDVRSAQTLMKLNREFYDAWLDERYGSVIGQSKVYKGGKKSFWGAISGGLENIIDGFGKDPMVSWCIANGVRKQLWNLLP